MKKLIQFLVLLLAVVLVAPSLNVEAATTSTASKIKSLQNQIKELEQDEANFKQSIYEVGIDLNMANHLANSTQKSITLKSKQIEMLNGRIKRLNDEVAKAKKQNDTNRVEGLGESVRIAKYDLQYAKEDKAKYVKELPDYKYRQKNIQGTYDYLTKQLKSTQTKLKKARNDLKVLQKKK